MKLRHLIHRLIIHLAILLVINNPSAQPLHNVAVNQHISIEVDSGLFAFAWSPRGDQIAWLRHTKQRYCEIIICDFATHIEHPVVSDTTTKDEICWISNNQLIYSSSVRDGMNLYMVSPSGGKALTDNKRNGKHRLSNNLKGW